MTFSGFMLYWSIGAGILAACLRSELFNRTMFDGPNGASLRESTVGTYIAIMLLILAWPVFVLRFVWRTVKMLSQAKPPS